MTMGFSRFLLIFVATATHFTLLVEQTA